MASTIFQSFIGVFQAVFGWFGSIMSPSAIGSVFTVYSVAFFSYCVYRFLVAPVSGRVSGPVTEAGRIDAVISANRERNIRSHSGSSVPDNPNAYSWAWVL